MAKFVTIGERLSTTAPAVNKAFTERDPEPIIKRAKQQLDAGATYLDVNIGPAENDGEDLMKWAVQLLQSEFDNVPLALDTTNKKAIEAGISVYNRAKGKPIVNSADAGDRITNIDLAAANDAICIALCSSGVVDHGVSLAGFMGGCVVDDPRTYLLLTIPIGIFDQIQQIISAPCGDVTELEAGGHVSGAIPEFASCFAHTLGLTGIAGKNRPHCT